MTKINAEEMAAGRININVLKAELKAVP